MLKIIVLLSIRREREERGKDKDDDDYGDVGKRKCVGWTTYHGGRRTAIWDWDIN